MKKIILMAALALCPILATVARPLPAASAPVKPTPAASDVFAALPDSLFPYLDKAQRQELVRTKESLPDERVSLRSPLACDISLARLKKDRLKVDIDSVGSLWVVPLGAKNVCIIRTMNSPEPSSNLTVYNDAWQPVSKLPDSLLTARFQRPDTMSLERFEELKSMVEFVVPEVRYVGLDIIKIVQHAPLLSAEEKKLVKPILVQTNLKWWGEMFKIYEF